jgi:dsDNA-binding SOS-regulon protein
MVGAIGSASGGGGGISGNYAAKLAALNKQLAACEEELKTVQKQCSSVPTKESDQKALSTKIAALKAQITQATQSESSPSAQAVESSSKTAPQESKDQESRDSASSSFEVTQLALAREGHLGTRVNVRA